jgi:hypothetical protein
MHTSIKCNVIHANTLMNNFWIPAKLGLYLVHIFDRIQIQKKRISDSQTLNCSHF